MFKSLIFFSSRDYISFSLVINGLTNYWDFDNDLYDKIGKANLFGAVNVAFVNDRKGRANSAIYLNNGYINAPNGYYFSGELSMTAWVNPISNNTPVTFINFAGDPKYSRFYIAIYSHGTPYFGPMYYNTSFIARALSQTKLKFNCWNHLAVTIDGSFYRIYINGSLTGTLVSNYLPENFFKYSNIIGNNRKIILDQLKFFNRALSLTEVETDMNSF